MSDFDIAVEKIWDHENKVELENEQDAVHGPESSAKYPRYKIHFLDEAIALLREAVNLHTVQNIALANESKVDSPLNWLPILPHIVQIQ